MEYAEKGKDRNGSNKTGQLKAPAIKLIPKKEVLEEYFSEMHELFEEVVPQVRDWKKQLLNGTPSLGLYYSIILINPYFP